MLRTLYLWRLFKKLAQAIQIARKKGARVLWCQKINGFRFSAAVFRSYGDGESLIVVDCVKSSAPISKSQMDNFVEKSRKAHAHIAILASQAEFSEESLNVAAENGV